jgi:CHAT domain-containing protein/tetratricopeptide (TPR) repeat protein
MIVIVATTTAGNPLAQSPQSTPPADRQSDEALLRQADEARKDKSPVAQKHALELYRRVTQETTERAIEARAWNGAGQAAAALEDPDTAFDCWKRAANAAVAAGDRGREADATYLTAYLLLQQQRVSEAAPQFERAAALHQAVGNAMRAGMSWNNLGVCYSELGETRRALDAFEKALELRGADPFGQALTLSGMASVEWRRGEYESALEMYGKSLSLFRGLKALPQEADILNNQGLALADLGQASRAEASYQDALRLWKAADDRAGEARTLNNLGMLLAVHHPARAMPLLRRARDAFGQLNDTRGKAYTAHNLGDALTSLRQYAQARQAYAESLAMKRELGDQSGEAYTLRSLGNLETRQRRFPQAIGRFDEALAIWRAIEDRNGEAATLADLAYCESEAGSLEPAIGHAEDALRLIESSRADLTAPNLRMSFLSSWDELYELVTDLWMRRHARDPGKGYEVAAFDARERGRARVLLDSLARVAAPPRQNGQSGLDDLGEERRLREKTLAQGRLLSQAIALRQGKQREDQARRELSAVEFEYQQARSRNENNGPATGRPLPLAEIRAKLPLETSLLVYAIGRRRSYVWSISQERLVARTLPSRAAIAPLVAQLRRAAQARVAGSDATAEARGVRIAAADAEFDRVAGSLSRILIAPVASSLARRILIVPDGPLHFLPFAALPMPGSNEPLLARHEPVWLPSASFAAVHAAHAPVRRVAIFADPVYGADDPRLNGAVAGRGSGEAGELILPRLRSSGEEGREIARLAPGEAVLRTGIEADKSALKTALGQNFDVLHLAVHTLLDADHPQTSGIALSMFDAHGRVEDGLLRLSEIYPLRLSTELVVLSSCESHLGKEYAGEGLASIAHALLHAGARQVAATLWPVADGATTPLMRRFYREMLHEREAPAEALRRAQLSLRDDAKYHAPFYWAGFMVEGL